VHELEFHLPKFVMYMAVQHPVQKAQGSYRPTVSEYAFRVAQWTDAGFRTSLQSSGAVDSFDINFISLRS